MRRRLPLAAFLVSRLLNHLRFPDGRAHGFAAPLRVALGLRPKCPQGTRFPSRLWTLETLARSGGGGGPHPWRERWARGRAYRGGSGRMQRGFCRLGQGAWPGEDSRGGAARRVSCIPVAQSFALPCRSRSWFRCPASGRFGPSAQQPTGLTLPFAPLDTRNARAQRGRGRPAPMARAVGAGTRLPRRERAHAAGLLPGGAEEHGPA